VLHLLPLLLWLGELSWLLLPLLLLLPLQKIRHQPCQICFRQLLNSRLSFLLRQLQQNTNCHVFHYWRQQPVQRPLLWGQTAVYLLKQLLLLLLLLQ
jgi:hypothetical protein